MEHSVQNTSDSPHPSSARCDSPFGTCLILLPASKPSCVPALVGLAYDDVNRTQSLLNDPSRVWQLEQCRFTRPGYAFVGRRVSIAGRGKKGRSISRPTRKSAHPTSTFTMASKGREEARVEVEGRKWLQDLARHFRACPFLGTWKFSINSEFA
jgi:hypothetical protein